MNEFLIWVLIIINLILSITAIRASFRNVDHLEQIDNALNILDDRKVDKAKFQQIPKDVPLEKM